MRFNIQWPNGRTTVEESECRTADKYAMERWGVESADRVATQFGIVIERVREEDELIDDREADRRNKIAFILRAKAAVAAARNNFQS